MNNIFPEYPVVIQVPIAWGEMDAFSHVNNIVYFRYFESTRIEYFNRLELMAYMKETGVGPILASTSCRYKAPLTYPDNIWVGAKTTEIGSDRFTMAYAIFSEKLNRIVAEGEGVAVTFNYRENKKVPLPEVIRQRIEKLEQSR